jgi:sulfhydrogenase subunit gamma (sulfur reductase)
MTSPRCILRIIALLQILAISKWTTITTSAFAPAFVFMPGTLQQQHTTSSSSASALQFTKTLSRSSVISTRSNQVLYMGWGPEPIWTDSVIVGGGAIPACESGKSVIVQVQVPEESAKLFTVPGQYVQMRPKAGEGEEPAKPLFLAIASPPNTGSTTFEFLIKKNDNNSWITSIADNTIVEISQVLGNGYAIDENIEGLKYDFPTQNILLFAAGSGIAPIASAIREGKLSASGSRSCRLYYGERTAADLCYIDQYTVWEELGIQVVPVLSSSDDDWNGRTGYVQNALEEDGIIIPRNTASLLCGMKGMTESVKSLLTQAGVFEGRILLNF